MSASGSRACPAAGSNRSRSRAPSASTPKVLILDEPTANLSVMATERLLETMAELKRQGVAQIIICHRLNDIFEVGDRVMVLKRGAQCRRALCATPTSTRCWS